jgi:hypothetical protein
VRQALRRVAAALPRRSLSGPLGTYGKAEMGVMRVSLSGTILIASILTSSLAGCAYRTAVHQDQLAAYRGDGRISKIEFLPNPGVELTFAPFSLARPFSAVYRIDGLPKRPSPYWVDLVVPDPGDQWRIRSGEPIRIGVPGTLKLSAHRATGEPIFECQWSPEEDGWSIGAAGAAAGFLDHIHKRPKVEETRIYPEDFKGPGAGPATLEVTWEPGVGVPNKMGYVRMQSGGTK